MKNILLINTNYRDKGGEDTNFIDESYLLEKFYKTKSIIFSNKSSLNFFDFLAFITSSNFLSNKKVKIEINNSNPEFAYIHNTWFKANLGIFKILLDSNIKIFIKVHNYRFACTRFFLQKNHIKKNSTCLLCNNSNKKNKLINKYFKESYLKSFLIILYGKKYYKILQNPNINLLVMSEFQKKYFTELGFEQHKIKTLFNPISVSAKNIYRSDSDYLVFAGRLSGEKGIYELLQAWNNIGFSNLKLKIIGSAYKFDYFNLNEYKNVNFLGELDHTKTLKIIENSRGVVTATKMYEVQPKLFFEAISKGIPVLFPNFGGMPEFFPENYCLKFEQFNYLDLEEKLKIFENKEYLENISNQVFNYYQKNFSNETYFSKFSDILNNQ